MSRQVFALCWALGAGVPALALPSRVAVADETYAARGAVESIAPDRESVRIAHEAIAGYMPAMTMSFETTAKGQLDGLTKGDRVRFTFRVTEDGHRLLGLITKEPGK